VLLPLEPALLAQLNGLLPQQLNDLVLTLGVPPYVLPPPSAAHGDRVFHLVNWVQGSSGPGISLLQKAIEDILRSPTTAPDTAPLPEALESTCDQTRLRGLLPSPRKPGVGAERSERMVYAARRWLKPEASLDRLEKLREDAGLADMDMGVFVRRLLEACAELEEEHPQLGLWIARRTALLEYKIATLAELSSDPPTSGTNLNYSLFTVLMELGAAANDHERTRARRKATQVAEETLQQALTATGQVVCRTLSRRPAECGFWSNLMVAAGVEVLGATFFSQSVRAKLNIAAARELWGELPVSGRCLVVVAETNEEPEHLGFWLPLHSPGRSPTPGATTAYHRAKASAVFVDDLPPTLGSDLPATSHAPWSDYLRQRFRQAVFVSVPFVLEVRGGQKKVPAVVNVNIDPAGEFDCRRAYHEEWLRVCQRETAQLVCEAYKAFALLNPLRV
jgi:hypothetical protein